MKKYLPWRSMDLVCGANRTWLKTGKALTVGGLIMAAVGYAITTDTIYKLDHPAEVDMAKQFVEDVLDTF